MPFILFFIITILAGLLCHAQDFREFTDTDGRKTTAKIIKVAGDTVTIQLQGVTKYYDVPIERFSQADKDYIKKWAEDISIRLTSSDDFEVYVGVKKTLEKSGSRTWRYKEEKLTPTVKFTNGEFKKDFKGVHGIIAIIGVDFTNSSNFCILDVQKFDLGDVSRNTVAEWEGKLARSFWMDDDDAYDDSFGFKYRGYTVAILNHKDQEVFRRASRSVWERTYKQIEKLSPGYTYDTELRSRGYEIPKRSNYR